jgi:hypothetical protein
LLPGNLRMMGELLEQREGGGAAEVVARRSGRSTPPEFFEPGFSAWTLTCHSAC